MNQDFETFETWLEKEIEAKRLIGYGISAIRLSKAREIAREAYTRGRQVERENQTVKEIHNEMES